MAFHGNVAVVQTTLYWASQDPVITSFEKKGLSAVLRIGQTALETCFTAAQRLGEAADSTTRSPRLDAVVALRKDKVGIVPGLLPFPNQGGEVRTKHQNRYKRGEEASAASPFTVCVTLNHELQH